MPAVMTVYLAGLALFALAGVAGAVATHRDLHEPLWRGVLIALVAAVLWPIVLVYVLEEI